eukprot:CAMPEP_0184270866 /NCGR_PEP_ID=MMETSP0977-20130417/38090_1 /TAXON_ID=483370 /ORGANISM="non described non described, Strain CCMP2097" /LENGTH=105 /DNA_ID=CAMNT_0026576715 /DNA_START=97 /DNA_END=411 /DNA_ORIENTATION=-
MAFETAKDFAFDAPRSTSAARALSSKVQRHLTTSSKSSCAGLASLRIVDLSKRLKYCCRSSSWPRNSRQTRSSSYEVFGAAVGTLAALRAAASCRAAVESRAAVA